MKFTEYEDNHLVTEEGWRVQLLKCEYKNQNKHPNSKSYNNNSSNQNFQQKGFDLIQHSLYLQHPPDNRILSLM